MKLFAVSKRIRRRLISIIRLSKIAFLNPNFKIGENYTIGKYCSVSRKNTILIGRNFFMGNYCHLAANAQIGNDVLFASFVSLVGGDHKIDNISVPIKYSGFDEFKTIIIENNVWIGHGTIIMHGVVISTGAVIAAGSVVTKDIPENEIWGGNPAKFIRKRKFKK